MLCYSPRNVLQDEAGHLKVTDFGLSKIAQEKDAYGYKMTGGTGSCMICPHTTDYECCDNFQTHAQIN